MKKNSEKIIFLTVLIGVFSAATGSYFAFESAFGQPNLETGDGPRGLGVNSFTNKIYIANYLSDTVSVIDGETNTVEATIPIDGGGGIFVTSGPAGVAVNPYQNLILCLYNITKMLYFVVIIHLL